MTVWYRLGLSGFAVDDGTRHDWRLVSDLPVHYFELCLLADRAELERAHADLRFASFGVHWPLWRGDPPELQLASVPLAELESTAAAAVDRVADCGADYLLAHFPGRGEVFPDDAEAAERLRIIGAAAGRLTIVLEPKEPLQSAGGLSHWARAALELLPGTALCVDTNDLLTALRHRGASTPAPSLAGKAEVFHLHAMHVLPGRGGRYHHAPPWVAIDGVDAADLLQIEPETLDVLAARDRIVTVQIEVPPRYRQWLPASLAAVRSRLAAMGWREAPAERQTRSRGAG